MSQLISSHTSLLRLIFTMPIEPLHPHQSALEKIFDFSARPPLNAAQRQAVEERFTELIERFNQPEGEDGEYNRVKLVQLTYHTP